MAVASWQMLRGQLRMGVLTRSELTGTGLLISAV